MIARLLAAATSVAPAPLADLDPAPTADVVAAAPDPYWPKWDGPWWRLLLLHELGATPPSSSVDALIALGARTWLPVFPRTQAELDRALSRRPGLVFDGVRHVICFCALGGLATLAHASGADLDSSLPWWRDLVVQHQLPDGGWNCDESAHLRPSPCPSIVSTAPVLEALLDRHATLSRAERSALDRGLRYLLERCLVRSLRKDAVIDAAWLSPSFPRFYGYDALRGLSLVARWARITGSPLLRAAITDVLDALSSRVVDGAFTAGRNDLVLRATSFHPPADGGAAPWTGKQPPAIPPLLARAIEPGPSAPLHRSWLATLEDLAALDRAGRLW